MSTVSPINGLPIPDGDSPGKPPIHFEALVTAIDTLLNSRFASTAERDAAIPTPVPDQECTVNGVGKQVYVTGKGWVTVYNYDPLSRQRQWYVGRTDSNGGFNDLSAGTMTTLLAVTITNAPVGDYGIRSRQVISGTAAGAGFQQITVNSVSVDPTVGTSQPRADIIVGGTSGGQGPRHVFTHSAGYTHLGGDMTVRSLYNGVATGTPRVWSQGTELTIEYLGLH